MTARRSIGLPCGRFSIRSLDRDEQEDEPAGAFDNLPADAPVYPAKCFRFVHMVTQST